MVVGDFVRRTAVRYPKKVGVIYEDKRFTWQDVNTRVNCLANSLLSMGLKKQDRIAILCRNCHQYLEFYFAGAKAGLIGVPLNTRFLGRELSYLLKDSGAVALFVDQQYVEVVKSISSELKDVKHYIGIGESHPFDYDYEDMLKHHSGNEPKVTVNGEDIYVIAYTSGTTGRPKGAIITHKNSVSAGINQLIEARVAPHDVFLAVGPFYFGAAAGQRFPAIIRGSTIVIASFDALKVLQLIEREKVTFFFSNPVALNRLIKHPDRNEYDLSSIRYLAVTAAPFPVTIFKEAQKVFGDVIFPQYGVTESGPNGLILQKEEVTSEGPLSKRMASVGIPWVNIDIKVVNEAGKDVAQDSEEVGEIILRGDSVSKGYWNSPEETAARIRDGWFYTEDLATVDADGYIYIADRKNDVINSGGMKVYPREIEEVLYSHPAIFCATVIGVPDEIWGETIKALIVLKEGAQATDKEIIALCKANLASYKKPTSVEFVDNLPMTPSGKILKRVVREKYWKDIKRQ